MRDSLLTTDLINAFRCGDRDAGNQLLQRYRPWLRLLAQLQVDSRFQRRFDASDVVQQTMLQAVRDFPQFRGTTEAEFTAWLRQVLAHALGHEIQRHRGAAKRDIGREVSIDQQLAKSSQNLRTVLADDGTSPSDKAIQNEREILLVEVLERLPDDYREVIILRNLQGLPHEEVARLLNRNIGATRMLWVRALARLKKEVEAT